MTGKAMTDPAKADIAAPKIPKCKTSGIMGIISPTKLTNVTKVTYSCFPTAKNSDDDDPDIALRTPKGTVNKVVTSIILIKAIHKRCVSLDILANTGKVTREKTSATSVIGIIERE